MARWAVEKYVDFVELFHLQFCIESKFPSGAEHPTFEIFRLIGSTTAGEIASNIDYLRRFGTESLRVWLSNVDNGLEQRIKDGDCPHIILSPVILLHRGEIPDGNHRVLAALRLGLRGEKVALPAYQIEGSTSALRALNTLVCVDRLRSNPAGTMSLISARYGSRQ